MKQVLDLPEPCQEVDDVFKCDLRNVIICNSGIIYNDVSSMQGSHREGANDSRLPLASLGLMEKKGAVVTRHGRRLCGGDLMKRRVRES